MKNRFLSLSGTCSQPQTFMPSKNSNLGPHIYPQYLKGATSPAGRNGGEIVVGEAFTINSGEEAYVTSTQNGDKTYLNFYIPKGDNGNSERIMTGQGMLTVADKDIEYELVNIQKKSLFLVGGNIMQTISNSYFALPMLS